MLKKQFRKLEMYKVNKETTKEKKLRRNSNIVSSISNISPYENKTKKKCKRFLICLILQVLEIVNLPIKIKNFILKLKFKNKY